MNAEPKRSETARLIGWILIGIGVLWAGLSGTCAVVMFTQTDADRNAQALYTMFGIIGAFSALVGLAIFVIGRWLSRR